MKFGLKPNVGLVRQAGQSSLCTQYPGGKNEGVEGRSGGADEEEDWVNGWLFIFSFPHPVSCKDGHPI